ncbi:MAG: deoxyribonuclease IV [Parachlamydia sp.]|jgi:deoxyribonuclease-4|nr:deoxyribonuclease IV [Parachlamydia sp.]
MTEPKILVGAHTSAAGGVHNALLEGKKIGATTIQFFTSNQKQWKGKQFIPDDIERWKRTLDETEIEQVMSHDSYLINLGCPNPENLAKSRTAFAEELVRCTQLGVHYLNFHPGASLTSELEQCLDLIVESLLLVKPLVEQGTTRLLLEATAGQGSSVGHRFEHLSYIIDRVKEKIPIGVCIDTCHIFVAGYDIRTSEAWDRTLKEFDEVIGLEHLYAFHLNDSLKDIGSRVDRHAALGEGKIGWDCFKFLMSDQRTRHLPKYLETPGGVELWEKEIVKLRGCLQFSRSGFVDTL